MLENISKLRKIFLSENITATTIKGIVDKVFDITDDDNQKIEEFKSFERKPIQLYINSFGGSVYDGLSLVDIIRNNETPIHTYCFGSAMSMAFWIFMSSDTRYMGKNSTLLYHEVSCFLYDKLEGIKKEVSELERLQLMLDTLVVENSNILLEKLSFIKERKTDWYIPAQEALKFGLCHKVL